MQNYNEFKQRRLTFWKCMMVTTLSYAASKTITAPLERVKLILQVSPLLKGDEQFNRSLSTFNQVYRKQGFLSFWRGNALNIFKTIPNAVIRFTVYDKFKQYASEYRQKETYSRQIINRLIAGFSTALLNLFMHYPLDVIRIKMTVDVSHFNKEKLYTGFYDCIKKTIRTQGVKGFYQGFLISSIGSVPYMTVGFLTHDYLRDYVPLTHSDNVKTQFLQFLGIGTISSISSIAATYPLDTIRRRMQLNGSLGCQRSYFSLKDCCKKIMKNEGIFGYYRGFWISLIRVIPASSIQFACFDYLKDLTT